MINFFMQWLAIFINKLWFCNIIKFNGFNSGTEIEGRELKDVIIIDGSPMRRQNFVFMFFRTNIILVMSLYRLAFVDLSTRLMPRQYRLLRPCEKIARSLWLVLLRLTHSIHV